MTTPRFRRVRRWAAVAVMAGAVVAGPGLGSADADTSSTSRWLCGGVDLLAGLCVNSPLNALPKL